MTDDEGTGPGAVFRETVTCDTREIADSMLAAQRNVAKAAIGRFRWPLAVAALGSVVLGGYLLVLAWSLTLALFFEDEPMPGPDALVAWLAPVCILLFLASHVLRRIRRRAFAAGLQQRFGEKVNIDVAVNRQGVRFATRDGEVRLAWSAISDIALRTREVRLSTAFVQFTIPLAAFRDSEEMAHVHRQIHLLWRSAGYSALQD